MIGGNAIVMKLALVGISLKASQVRNRTRSITWYVTFIPYNTGGYLIFYGHNHFRNRKTNCKPSGVVSLIEGFCLRSSETRPDGVSYYSLPFFTLSTPTMLTMEGLREISAWGVTPPFFFVIFWRAGGEKMTKIFLCNQGQNTAQNTFLKHGLTLVM